MVPWGLCSIQVRIFVQDLAFIEWLNGFFLCSEIKSFDELTRDLILRLPYAIPLPEEDTVFDYFLDLKSYQFLPWSKRKADSQTHYVGGYVVLPEVHNHYAIIMQFTMWIYLSLIVHSLKDFPILLICTSRMGLT